MLSGVPLALNLAALGVAAAAGLTSTAGLLGALCAANLLATGVRFAVLRRAMGS